LKDKKKTDTVKEDEKPRWRVLYTRPRYEKKIFAQLAEMHVTAYLPLREEIRYWSDRRKIVETPLFLGYVFVKVVERERMAALEIPGAIKYVSFGGKLAEVSEETIEDLRIMMTRPRDVRLEETTLRLGQKVHVQAGPLMGMSGNLVEFRGSTRVAIMIESINRMVSIEVPISYLKIKRN
jgi:transcription antitermination factor NusG